MNRKELTHKLQEVMNEIEAIYKKHNCAGIFVVYHPGGSGHVGGVDKPGYQHEGQGGFGSVLTTDYSVVKRLSDIAPDHPALKEQGVADIHVLAITPEQASWDDKDQLTALISPTINMARTVSILASQGALMCVDLAKNSEALAQDLGIGNTVTGEGMDSLPAEVVKNSMH